MTGDNWLVTVEPQSGGIDQFHTQLESAERATGLAWDGSTNTLYISAADGIYSLDPLTLTTTLIWRNFGIPLIATTIDPSAGIMYLLTGSGAIQVWSMDLRAQFRAPTPRFTFPSYSAPLTSLAIDPVKNVMYGISANNIVTVNPTDWSFTTLMTVPDVIPMYWRSPLAVVPGSKTFFVTDGLRFEKLDADSGQVTLMGDAYIAGGAPPGGLVYRNFPVEPEKIPDPGQIRYLLRDVCFPRSCDSVGLILSDSGLVAGAGLDGAYGQSFFVEPGGELRLIDLPVSRMMNVNRAGVIAGSYVDSSFAEHAFIYLTSEQALYDLNPVFGWESGYATFVNNKGQITGYSLQGASVFGYHLDLVFGINDNGLLFGGIGDPISGKGVVIENGQLSTLPLLPYIFNNKGQALFYLGHGSYTDTPQVYTPAAGMVTLPGFRFATPIAINDNGLVLLDTHGPSSTLFDISGAVPDFSNSPRSIRYFVPELQSEWTNTIPLALNNAGQILLRGTSRITGRMTALLLTPRE
jgi:hypothetical protein